MIDIPDQAKSLALAETYDISPARGLENVVCLSGRQIAKCRPRDCTSLCCKALDSKKGGGNMATNIVSRWETSAVRYLKA